MNVSEYARVLLEGSSVKDKLLSSKGISDFSFKDKSKSYSLPKYPGRDKEIQFDDKQMKFPKKGSFHQKEQRAKALHFFANHELLAIEMMAAALLKFPVETKNDLKIQQGIISTIDDEQKHFKLYNKRMNELGVEFGDYPLNDFFWRQMSEINDFREFFAVMALTFEAANLDFAKFYGEIFQSVGDDETAKLMNIVYEDEITHVALGRHWLNYWKEDHSLWEYYCQILPGFLSPARSKGMIFDEEGRVRAGLDPEYIFSQRNYKDDFSITRRKEWKS